MSKASSKFAKSAMTLIGGTVFAQLLSILISPILTRLYSPEQFGVLGAFVSISSIAAIVFTARYELAFHLRESRYHDMGVLGLCCVSISLFSVLTWVIYWIDSLFHGQFSSNYGLLDFSLLFLLTLSLAFISTFTYCLNKNGLFREISISRIIQALAIAGLSVGGYFLLEKKGLIVATAAGQFAGAMILAWFIFKAKLVWKAPPVSQLVALMRKFRKLPTYLIFGHLLNASSQQLPVVLLTFYDPKWAGFFVLAQRMVRVPMSVVGTAVGDVFRQNAASQLLENGECRRLYISTLIKLSILGFFPALFVFFLSPMLFGFVFGPEWHVAGVYAALMSPMLFFQFISSPLVTLYILRQKQRAELAMQVCLFVLAIGPFSLGHALGWTVETMVLAFSIGYSLIYFLNMVVAYRYSCPQEG